MSKITGYILFWLGIVTVGFGVLFGEEDFAFAAFIGVALIVFGLSIISKHDKAQKKNKSDDINIVSVTKYSDKKSSFVLAAAIISLFISLTMSLAEIAQFLDYSQYTIVQTISGVMALQAILTIVACILFFMGWWKNDAGSVLVASIMACVAVLFMPLYLAFYAFPIIFGFIGYKKLKRIPASECTMHTNEHYSTEKEVKTTQKSVRERYIISDEERITFNVMEIVAEGEYVHEYSIAGVTFSNDDGSSRQDILQDIQSRGYCDNVEFLIEDFQGEISVAVFVDDEQIGHIKKANLKYFLDHYDRMTGVSEVFVDDFESDDDLEIKYYCKISVTYKKDRL